MRARHEPDYLHSSGVCALMFRGFRMPHVAAQVVSYCLMQPFVDEAVAKSTIPNAPCSQAGVKLTLPLRNRYYRAFLQVFLSAHECEHSGQALSQGVSCLLLRTFHDFVC